MIKDDVFKKAEIETVPKPWGHELIWGRTERYVGKVLHIRKGESLSLQYHEMKDETLFVMSGRVALEIRANGEERTVILNRGEAFHIPPGMVHRIAAEEDSDVAEVSTPELQDVVRLEDRYGRIATENK